ncbi:MAG: pyruvate formate lyase family protein, partial [bacterium]
MNDRVRRLREENLATPPSIDAERAVLLTRCYSEMSDDLSVPMQRAHSFHYLCEHKTIHLGPDEFIVGERGPRPMATPTFPELTCHSLDDLRILDSREKTSYGVGESVMRAYEEEIIPFWRGRSQRERIFAALPPEWHAAYEAGIFTEFMEQRAPGHTVADGKIFQKGMRQFLGDIMAALAAIDGDDAAARREQLHAMDLAAEA